MEGRIGRKSGELDNGDMKPEWVRKTCKVLRMGGKENRSELRTKEW